MDFPKRLLDWLPIASHPSLSQMLVVGLIIVTGIVMIRLVRPRRPQPVPACGVWADGLSENVAVQARPLMNGSEVAMFNLLLFALRDHFLLLAKIPLRSLVRLRINGDVYKRILGHAIRNMTVDFVVVHPGTQLPVKAIFVRKPGDDVPASSSQNQLIDALLQTAEIEVIRLDQEDRYGVKQLTALLGLQEEA